jgi:hypothetical protein
MSNEKDNLGRRRALKVIALGTALPVLNNGNVFGTQDHAHQHHSHSTPKTTDKPKDTALKFFTPKEFATVATISELIIPTDDHSPGAKEAEVPAFIDLMVNESPAEVRTLWRDGLASVEKMSQSRFKKDFNSVTGDQQVELLTEISKNESSPKTLEEKFFKAIKNLTIDGYYTSEIGIHKDLRYKGNQYLKEFKGCTHPEHQA